MRQLLDFVNAMPEKVRHQTIKKNITPGETIVMKGGKVCHIYILLRGTVSVSNEFVNGHRYTFAEFDAPSLIGEVEALADQPGYAATIEAVTPCLVFSMDTAAFMLWLEEDPGFALLLAKLIAQKMYPTSNNNGSIKFMPSRQKVIAYLLESYDGSELFLLAKSRQQIADEIGTSVKTVNRCINFLKTNFAVTIMRGKVTITPPQAIKLRRLSESNLADT